MTELNVEECVLDVGVNPLDHLLLFLHHVGQLEKILLDSEHLNNRPLP